MIKGHLRLTAGMLILLGTLCACGEKTGTAETDAADAASRIGLSSSSTVGAALNAPGNYMRGMAGNVDKARKAAALAGKAAADNMDPGVTE